MLPPRVHHYVVRGIFATPIVTLLALLIANIVIICRKENQAILYARWLPKSAGTPEQVVGSHTWKASHSPSPQRETADAHPIRQLMQGADQQWNHYDSERSKTFKATVETYRRKYGRHPPPGFKQWYKFARQRQVYHIDDFDQINDDLRPFWALKPKHIRKFAAHASDDLGYDLSTVSIRQGQVFQEVWGSWRTETFISLLAGFAQHLPDMDLAMNRMDQPRVIVPWDQLQKYLAEEVATRSLDPNVEDAFTANMDGLYRAGPKPSDMSWWDRWVLFPLLRLPPIPEPEPPEDWGWFAAQGQQFMKFAGNSCPPTSHAGNTSVSKDETERSYKTVNGGFISNFNLSSDLCTVGPEIQDRHGMLYASTSMFITERLVPVFGECKVNVNNDILFPANMYWRQDRRYVYDQENDASWDDKDDNVMWRGVTSGGTQFEDNWRSMHRQRLVLLLNATEMQDAEVSILAEYTTDRRKYSPYSHFHPSPFASAHTDVGFVEKIACIPNCDFYNDTVRMLNPTTLSQQFSSKYLIDVDGHSFSGRWRAFLQSRSLGIKATIFREWHDSRLFAWRHFVPMDNRYDDLYSLLTYFIGVNSDLDAQTKHLDEQNSAVRVERHDYEAMKLAKQGRDWAAKVLRREDIEIYTYRLLLEYGRVVDDNREKIGFAGDGGEEMEEFDKLYPAVQ